MCGRFTMRTANKDLVEHFALFDAPAWEPRYNIAPTQAVLAVRGVAADAAQREAVGLRWGLVPFWADDLKSGSKLINARSETAATKPSFRRAFKTRRCLVPADGFFEWQAGAGGKQPHYIGLPGGALFAIAGLWESWDKEGTPVETLALLTTSANPFMLSIHDRMPVIVPPERYATWLDPDNQDGAALTGLCEPYQGELVSHPVSTWVNSPTHEGARCVEPV